jgi:hypothetical protein
MLPVNAPQRAGRGRVAGAMAAVVAAGFLLPIVPRVVMPRVRPGVYADAYTSWSDFGWPDAELCAWTATPFVFLAFGVRYALTQAEAAMRRNALSGVATAFVAAYVLGIILFMPGPPRGATCIHLAFPLFACLLLPLAYVAGEFASRVVTRSRGPEDPS